MVRERASDVLLTLMGTLGPQFILDKTKDAFTDKNHRVREQVEIKHHILIFFSS